MVLLAHPLAQGEQAFGYLMLCCLQEGAEFFYNMLKP